MTVGVFPLVNDLSPTVATHFCEIDKTGVQTFVAGNIYLDETEISNACLLNCVEAGACEPSVTVFLDDFSVINPQDETYRAWPAELYKAEAAKRYCEFRGGRLPTLAELRRAQVGEAPIFAQASIEIQFISCVGFGQCQNFQARSERQIDYVGSPPVVGGGLELGTVDASYDVGPFGHLGLTAGAAEFTSTRGDDMLNLCDQAQGSTLAQGDTGPFLLFQPMFSMDFSTHLADPFDHNNLTGIGVNLDDTWVGGVRCAYDVSSTNDP